MNHDPIDRMLMQARDCEPPTTLMDMEGAIMGRARTLGAQRRHAANLLAGGTVAALALLIGVGSTALPDADPAPMTRAADSGLALAPSTLLGARS